MSQADTIKSEIEKNLCQLHDIHPVVEINWDGIKIVCCCSEFHNRCVREAEYLLNKMSLPDKIINE